jgi:hypothetical protein
MIKFDDDKQSRQLADIRRSEEEDVVELLAGSKYGIPYANLTTTLVENEALRYIPETQARSLEIAPFKILGKTLHIGDRFQEVSVACNHQRNDRRYHPACIRGYQQRAHEDAGAASCVVQKHGRKVSTVLH